MELVFAILLLFLVSYLWFNLHQEQVRRKQSVEKNDELLKLLNDEKKYSESLSKYEAIKDIEAHVHGLKTKAEREAESVRKEARDLFDKSQALRDKLYSDSRESADRCIAEAKSEAAKIREAAKEFKSKTQAAFLSAEFESQSIIKTAHQNAQLIIDNANNGAKTIAGDALEAKRDADIYATIIKALKNKIDGYGDEWIIPNRSVLDELADQYEFKEAGEQLKRARSLTASLIKTEKAASCDYVENNRRETAIAFVLDAYNGKVDTALAKVKHNNYGKLLQEINDAFALVNKHGMAFRCARVTDTYHMARVNELKWAVAVNELMLEEREEQKQIREQLREEERARKEYEKAMKDAEKEEKKLQEMMDKVRAELAQANEQERAKLESKISELQVKYAEAEAKNQRAISMAQQTRAGHVYVISNVGSFGDDVFKIGMTRRLEPIERVQELGDASVPFSFDVHAMIFSDDAPALEKELHRRFGETQLNLVNPRKEFFKVPVKEIKQVVDEMGMQVHWTLMAEAREFRESQSIRSGRPHLVSVA